MLRVSPTAEGFRAAFRRPAFTLAEISWRWVVGATAGTLFLFGLFQYLDTLPVTSGELLFLRSRQPYLIAQALAHIFRGSLSRLVIAGLVAAILLGLLWMIAGSLGRIATVRGVLDYFRTDIAPRLPITDAGSDTFSDAGDRAPSGAFSALFRLNFLRASVALATVFGFFGATILAGFVSPDAHPRPGLAFLLFLPLAALVCLIWFALNWLLSLAGMFAVRDGEDVMGAVSAAVTFCRERTGPVLAVSTWTGLAHLTAFVAATTVISMPLGLAGLLPLRLVLLGVGLLSLGYFVLIDWLYMARLAGYVCIAETPEELLKPPPIPRPVPTLSPSVPQPAPPPLQTTIDRDELILSDEPTAADDPSVAGDSSAR